METILIHYQGEDLEVTEIDRDNTVLGVGTDAILRDEQGRYYFARHREPEDGGFVAVHRVNLNAVLLRAASTLNDSVTVRRDAADALMAHRSYDDPWPADAYHEIRAARGDQSADAWVAKVLAGEAMQQKAATLPGGTTPPTGEAASGPVAVSFELDPFHGDLLRAFERRNRIDPLLYAQAVVEWHLEEMYDHRFNGGETEQNDAQWLRDEGRINQALTPEEVAERCHAAGLNPADYPDACEPEEEADFDLSGPVVSPGVSGRRHTSNPADVALLAAAKPEPVDEDEEPLPEEEHVEGEDDDEQAGDTQDGKEGQ